MALDSDLRRNLLILARAYARAEGVPLSTVSKRAYGNGKFFDDLDRGGNATIASLRKVHDWFKRRWPKGVERPYVPAINMNF